MSYDEQAVREDAEGRAGQSADSHADGPSDSGWFSSLLARGRGHGDDEGDSSGLFDYRRNALSETIITTIVALLVLVLLYSLISEHGNLFITSVALAGLVTVAFATIRYTLSPDRLRAVQTKRTLSLASRTLAYMRGGLSPENCQEVCSILLPETQAMAVAMTDDKVVLGYAGEYADAFPIGSPIHTAATHRVLESQKLEVFNGSGALGVKIPPEVQRSTPRKRLPMTPAMREAQETALKHVWSPDQVVEIGAPVNSFIPAGIVAPLVVRGISVGTLKLYYDAPHLIDETQRAIAEGLAELLSTQLSIAELDRQVELATKAQLQALQSQINPHFLFNTINTIASLIRTDPVRARGLLREFAVFYRQTLENSSDLIPLEREIQQTQRYLGFEIARFGNERIGISIEVDPGLEEVRVPSFIIQPVVENSVNHAMRPEGMLHLSIGVHVHGPDVEIAISDDGIGMSQEQARNLVRDAGPSAKGTGIALRNVDGRLHAAFGPGSGVEVDSKTGVGTVVTLHLVGAAPDASDAG